MANDVQFVDNHIQVINAIADAVNAFLEEAAGELESEAARNTRVDSGDTKSKWDHRVTESQHEAIVGNPLENAIWEEFGTGEYALNHDGRKGYWVYVKGSTSKSKSSKTYTLEEAKRICASLRKKGLDAYYTKGKRPSRAFHKAKVTCEPKIIQAAKDIFGGMNT